MKRYEVTELQRILDLQRVNFVREGFVPVSTRRDRVARLAMALLSNIDAISETLSEDYGYRPAALTKAFEALAWTADIQHTLDHLEEWMAPVVVPGGFVQQKPKGVVGIVGAWNFPVALTFSPALEALAAGNRVMLNFPEFHAKTGELLGAILGKIFPEEELVLIHGDLATAQRFSELSFDHLFFTGSPKVGAIISEIAGRNLVPVTMELGGKNPVVVAPDADLDMAAQRIAATRVLNSGQICLCPDYVFVPREHLEAFSELICKKLMSFFPTYLDNPSVVSIVNERNFDRVNGLIDDAVSKGAQKIVAVSAEEAQILPDRASRLIPPTLLLNVPESAHIAHEEVFGPVLALYPYDDLEDAINYIAQRPSPLGAYWYGEDTAEFRHFLDHTNSGGVSRNDGIVHASLPGAPFGGVGTSGSGAYHGKAGFNTFTHQRAVANVTSAEGVADNLVNGKMLHPEAKESVDKAISAAMDGFRACLLPL